MNDNKSTVDMGKKEMSGNDIIYSKTVNAGKRIYYVDVKQNRKGELFLIITESKKILNDDIEDPVSFEKHKVFLYKEDFDKFSEALGSAISYIKDNNTLDFTREKENQLPLDDLL